MVSDQVSPEWPPPSYDPSNHVDTTAPISKRRIIWSVAAVSAVVLIATVAVFVLARRDATPPTAAPTTPAAPPTSHTANVPSGPCGPDETAALSGALAKVPPDRRTGKRWDPKPRSSNYNPCADLSAVVVTTFDATLSSPDLALMFHRGDFVGAATPVDYPYTTVEAPASTDDVVVLTYRTRQSCSECADGTLTTVGFQWKSDTVQMLDTPPEWLDSPP